MQWQRHVPVTMHDDGERRVVLRDIPWALYEALRAATDEQAGLHLTYLEGTLEIMSPSPRHEYVKKLTARLLEAWADELEVPLIGYGSTTYRKEAKQRGLEPDECYCFADEREMPDLAIEVVITSGDVDKLEVYRGLGVPEVWFWVNGRYWVYRLGDDGYARVPRSVLLPSLDLERMAEIVASTGPSEQPAAVREWRRSLRQQA